TLEIAVRSDPEAVILTVDGQVGVNLRREDRVLCRLSPQLLKLVRPPGRSYFDVLRNKLKWGTR
ncbi:MAG: NAD(+)/NADH kinase, partial [Terriglobales bacterium]